MIIINLDKANEIFEKFNIITDYLWLRRFKNRVKQIKKSKWTARFLFRY